LTLSEDETETPTKANKTATNRKKSNFVGKGQLLGDGPANGNSSSDVFANSSPPITVKSGKVLSEASYDDS
jgi:hypothetical protein